jgi:hypothetical protein
MIRAVGRTGGTEVSGSNCRRREARLLFLKKKLFSEKSILVLRITMPKD